MTAKTTSTERSKRIQLFSDQQIRYIAQNGSRNAIAEWVQATAHQYGVEVRPMPYDSFVKAVSRLSDGVVDIDPIEELLVALVRKNILTSFQSGLLQVNYLRQIKSEEHDYLEARYINGD